MKWPVRDREKNLTTDWLHTETERETWRGITDPGPVYRLCLQRMNSSTEAPLLNLRH